MVSVWLLGTAVTKVFLLLKQSNKIQQAWDMNILWSVSRLKPKQQLCSFQTDDQLAPKW